MSITIKNRYLILALLIAFLGIGGLGWYLGSKKTKDALNRLESANNELITYKAKIRQDSVIIVLSEQEVVSQKRAKQVLEITNRDLRTLNIKQANELSRLKFRIDTLLTHISHNGGIVIIHDTVIKDNDKKAILLPFNFAKKDAYLDLRGTFNNEGELDISLKMDAKVDIISGYAKKSKTPSIVISTDNPYLKTIGVRSFKTDVQKPKRFGIGIFTGYGINLSGDIKASPLIGVGLNYNVIRF